MHRGAWGLPTTDEFSALDMALGLIDAASHRTRDRPAKDHRRDCANPVRVNLGVIAPGVEQKCQEKKPEQQPTRLRSPPMWPQRIRGESGWGAPIVRLLCTSPTYNHRQALLAEMERSI